MTEKLQTALRTGENYYIEFKNEIISNNELSKEIVSFANAEGGVIYIGISDNGLVNGVSPDPSLEEKIMNILRNNCSPSLNAKVEWINYEDKHVLQLEVEKGRFKPYSTKDGDFYIRVGSTKRKASREELSRLLQSSGYFQFDNTSIGHSNIDDLEKGILSEYFKDIYKIDIYDRKDVPDFENLLLNTKILTISENKLCPSIAGLLTFGKKPQDFLFHTGIIFARINGYEIYDEIADSKQLEGRLPELIEQCLTLFNLYNKKQSIFENGRRIDQYDYPAKVFREIIVNAVCHRNYSISGSRIRVIILNDRYEVRSPGRLPNTITIDNIKQGASFLRNQAIFKFLNHYGYIENLGRGIPLSIRETISHSGIMPEFSEEGEEFVVRIYKKRLPLPT